jgi:hypothetical protein
MSVKRHRKRTNKALYDYRLERGCNNMDCIHKFDSWCLKTPSTCDCGSTRLPVALSSFDRADGRRDRRPAWNGWT